ncbi:MAG: DUF6152 family protein [Candidatus Rariloculaceae bacterium]
MPRTHNATKITVLAGAALITTSFSALSHHSRANFRFDSVLELEGTITAHEYRNPHTFLTLEMTAADGETVEWLLAGNSVSNLRQVGWTADTFAVGEQVTVRGNPDRDPDKLLLFLDTVTKQDGSEYISGRIAPGGQSSESRESVSRSTNFSGAWQPDFGARDIAAGFRPADLPMTQAGQAAVASYDMADDSALNCEPEGLPMTILPIYPVQFSRNGDTVEIWYEQFDGRRTVHLNMGSHPAGTQPSPLGHSIGRIEGNLLTIETAHFTEDNWGLGRGAPSGLQKTVVEEYLLSADGKTLDVEYTFNDPEFLTQPVTESGQLLLNQGYVMEEWDCDLNSARRHLSLD